MDDCLETMALYLASQLEQQLEEEKLREEAEQAEREELYQ